LWGCATLQSRRWRRYRFSFTASCYAALPHIAPLWWFLL
jgi:hypothetical protein